MWEFETPKSCVQIIWKYVAHVKMQSVTGNSNNKIMNREWAHEIDGLTIELLRFRSFYVTGCVLGLLLSPPSSSPSFAVGPATMCVFCDYYLLCIPQQNKANVPTPHGAALPLMQSMNRARTGILSYTKRTRRPTANFPRTLCFLFLFPFNFCGFLIASVFSIDSIGIVFCFHFFLSCRNGRMGIIG